MAHSRQDSTGFRKPAAALGLPLCPSCAVVVVVMALAPLAFGAMMDAGRYPGVWLGIALMLMLLIGTAVNVRRIAGARLPRPDSGAA